MAFQQVPDTCEVRYEYVGAGGVQMVTTLYVRDLVLSWNGLRTQALADLAEDLWVASTMYDRISDSIELVQTTTRSLDTEFGATGINTTAHTGGASGDYCPYSVCALVILPGDGGSPPRKGHIFHPGLQEADVTGNLISDVERGFIADDYQYIADHWSDGEASWAQVIVSRYSGFDLVSYPDGTIRKKPKPRTPAVTNTLGPISCRALVGSQRDRRPGA